MQRKQIFHFSLSTFFVPLKLRFECTFVRKNKKNAILFGFLLTYSYLCTRFPRNRWQEVSRGLLCCVGTIQQN